MSLLFPDSEIVLLVDKYALPLPPSGSCEPQNEKYIMLIPRRLHHPAEISDKIGYRSILPKEGAPHICPCAPMLASPSQPVWKEAQSSQQTQLVWLLRLTWDIRFICHLFVPVAFTFNGEGRKTSGPKSAMPLNYYKSNESLSISLLSWKLKRAVSYSVELVRSLWVLYFFSVMVLSPTVPSLTFAPLLPLCWLEDDYLGEPYLLLHRY